MKKSSPKVLQRKITIDDLARMIASGFSDVSDEFKKVYQRFDQVDEKFQEIDKKFETIDKRFDDIDKRFDALEAGTHRRLTIVENTVQTLVKK